MFPIRVHDVHWCPVDGENLRRELHGLGSDSPDLNVDFEERPRVMPGVRMNRAPGGVGRSCDTRL